MPQNELARVFDAAGPFASIYMNTSGDVENAAQHVAVRWKNLRAELARDGVPEATLEAVDPLVDGSHTAGRCLAVITAVDAVVWADNLPDPPPREALVRHGPVPYVLPLLAWQQTLVPHVAVLADRTGADMAARVPRRLGHVEHVEGAWQGPHLHRSHPGGWSAQRYQHRAEVLWERNAGEVAEALTKLVDHVQPRFVAAAGDVRALQLLRDESPKRVRELIEVVGGEYASLDAVFDKADELAAGVVERDTGTLLERFAADRAGGLAADGTAATIAGLGKGQVDTLLVRDDPDDDRTAWIGEAPVLVATDADTLAALGVATPMQGRLVDAAVRAALGTGAGVRVLGGGPGEDDPEGPAPAEGLGALFRFAG